MIKSSDGNKLAIVNPDAAGIDIADAEMQVCVPEDRDGDNNRRFGSFTCELNEIITWLKDCHITTVAMEATGIYYLSLFLKLQDADIEVILVNPLDVKNLAGHKTDSADAEWLMLLHRYGLLKPCYQPGNAARQIRNLTRQRNNLLRSAEKQILYMQKSLELMNVKLSTVISDVTGLSGRRIISAILAGNRIPEYLASLAMSNCKASKEEIALSLEGTWDADLLFTLKQSVEAYDFFINQIADCDHEIEKLLKLYQAQMDTNSEPLVRYKRKKSSRSKNAPVIDIEQYAFSIWGVNVFEIPGLKDTAVMQLIGLGHDFIDKFETAEKFSRWCNLVPNNKISGGKLLSSRIMKKKNIVGQIFRTAASPMARDKGEVGNYYRRIRARSGALQANVATAHKIAKIFYTMVKTKHAYDPGKVGLCEKEITERKIAKLEKALARLMKAS